MSGWYPDPTGRFEHRYHNDAHWTADVASGGRRFVDPLPSPVAPLGAPPSPVATGGNGIAIAAMVCGIVAIVIAWIPFLGILGLAAAIVGLALGIPALARSRPTGQRRGPAIAGIVTSSVGLALGVLGIVLSVVLFRALQRFEDEGPTDVRLTSCTAADGDVVAIGELVNLDRTERDYTVLVELTPGIRTRVEVDDVGPGDTATFTARQRAVATGEPDCRVVAVDGPIPFGLDPDLFEES